MNYIKREDGFTLIEVMAVIIIIGVLAAIAIPKLASSTVSARQKADVATAHEVKTALDRYQVEKGTYPTDLKVSGGVVSSVSLIPKYISKLDKSTTQQSVDDAIKGFGLVSVTADATDPMKMTIPDSEVATNTIMIYLNSNSLAAEVRAYDESLTKVLWTSAD
ncbi:Prepilin-type N-terminal cleavage/methylation domain protein [Candidatus Desulfosporosinus infrequens]|uniref:Prepilin-type N-terminal cleavage/methylation domain protein n=1 Tax=Candidatus Desulfosporosinus infrequens TaxID=2043169 RepID=A0A2U3K061_9FIRM|nr:Prepilin-type N-terminal cleavage/methylation domain protein [Candidatus Desulfosporosinus infrequens]